MVQLVGILNLTPDSFSDGGAYFDVKSAITRARQMFDEGASIVDVGAESTRPNATQLASDEEWQRLRAVLTKLLSAFPGRISLDSYHPDTVRRAYDLGPVIVNDVTGFNDPEMVALVAELMPPKVIVSHMPRMDIQTAHTLQPVSSIHEVQHDLLAKAVLLHRHGVDRTRIILDPGIGFGKTMELNKQLLSFAELVPDYEVMIGYSRKRFLGDRRMELEPNLQAGMVATAHGATYLRIHDVAGHSGLLS